MHRIEAIFRRKMPSFEDDFDCIEVFTEAIGQREALSVVLLVSSGLELLSYLTNAMETVASAFTLNLVAEATERRVIAMLDRRSNSFDVLMLSSYKPRNQVTQVGINLHNQLAHGALSDLERFRRSLLSQNVRRRLQAQCLGKFYESTNPLMQ